MSMHTQFEDLPPETQKFLSELRGDEIETLEAGIRLVRSVQTVGNFVKWLLVGIMGIVVGTVMLADSIHKIWLWLKAH